MASTKTSQNNKYVYSSIDQLKFVQMNYFTTQSNNAQSCDQKIEIIQLICFLTQKMHEKDPEKYDSALKVLSIIFNDDFTIMEETSGDNQAIRSFGLICDDLLWGTNTPIKKPEGYSNASEIKDKIISYFKEELAPF